MTMSDRMLAINPTDFANSWKVCFWLSMSTYDGTTATYHNEKMLLLRYGLFEVEVLL